MVDSTGKMKKSILLPGSLLVLLAGSLFGGAFLDFFSGRSDGTNIILEWKTRTENNVQLFDIQRKPGTNGEYVSVGTVEPKGANAFYSFIDRSAYKHSESVYTYRLRILENGNSSFSYSNEVTISHSVSSVRRTWGSIKAMFR